MICNIPSRILSDASRRGEVDKAPFFSLIMPIYNPKELFLERAIASLGSQTFSDWELCMADDASSEPSVWPKLAAYAAADPRIKICRQAKNGHISRATNAAAALARGDFLAFMDQDDALTPNCLELLARYIEEHPETDLLYTDDDKIDINERCYDAQYKQSYDPMQLLNFMAMGHILCVRRSLYEALGGFRTGFEGSQDYDFVLRAVEHAKHVGHVPAITYHWRSHPGSTAAGGEEKSYSFEAGRKAVQEALVRRCIPAKALHPDWARAAGCGIFEVRFSCTTPVTVVLPVLTSEDIVPEALARLEKVQYPAVTWVVATPEGVSLPPLPKQMNIVRFADADSVETLCNAAAKESKDSLLVFLSPDLVPHNDIWLNQLAGWAELHGIGCVGGKIYQSNGTILHAGYLHGLEEDGLPGRVEFGAPDSWGNHFRLVTSSRCSGVSTICLAIARKTFLSAGGFDTKNFSILAGAELGYRLEAQHLFSLMCPEARFTCLRPEVLTAREPSEAEKRRFKARYGRIKRAVNPHIAYGTTFFKRAYRLPLERPVRVLFISHGLAPEGAPKTLQELVRGLAAQGSIVPKVWSHLDGPVRKEYTDAGIAVKILTSGEPDKAVSPTDSGMARYVAENLSFLPMHDEPDFEAAIERFAQHMAEEAPDVVVANTVLAFWAVLAAAKANLPCIWIIRESESPFSHFDALPPFIKEKAAQALSIPYRLIFVAEATRSVFGQFSAHNDIVIHNALSARFAQDIAHISREEARQRIGACKDELIILTLGSVFERKGQMDIIEACSKLDARFLDGIRFVIVGDRPGTPYSIKLHEAWEKLEEKRKKQLTIIPETKEPALFYRAADIFVCCSRVESFPRIILEAMTAELPIITTPVFGIREQVADGENALFYEPGDIMTLCRHITFLAENENARHALGKAAHEALALLPTYGEMLKRYETIFREAAAKD